jgi:hypothetical protein
VPTYVVCRGHFGLPWCSSWLLNVLYAEVGNAQEGSQRCCFVVYGLLDY